MKTTLIIILCCIHITCVAQESKIYEKDGFAIKGFDPVAYFTEGKPTLGNEQFMLESENTTWLFSSEENLYLFKKNSAKYTPQYGGYCAWGMREGYKAPTNPRKAWTVFEDKLYLNYNTNTMKGWKNTKKESILIADQNWTDFKHKD